MDLFSNMSKRNSGVIEDAINPLDEMAAYEAIWSMNPNMSFKKVAKLFADNPGLLPSDLVDDELINEFRSFVLDQSKSLQYKHGLNFLIKGVLDYPHRLKDATDQVELLYFTGNLDYLATKSISIVGTRNPTKKGVARTKKLVELLVRNNFTIVSGLAAGIDTAAHEQTLKSGGRTIGVIGTPLNTVYPSQNIELQKTIAEEHLLVSQVPFYKYFKQTYKGNRLFFPERNKTMSAITMGTVIVEASDTSGTLIQAKAAFEQGRKLFILESCFQNDSISWPQKFEDKGAIRVSDFSDILDNLRD